MSGHAEKIAADVKLDEIVTAFIESRLDAEAAAAKLRQVEGWDLSKLFDRFGHALDDLRESLTGHNEN